MGIKEFTTSCLNDDPDIVVQKHLVEGSSYYFDTFFKGTEEEFIFKKDISLSLDVHLRDIAIVGSGKLGFSIKPNRSHPSYYSFKEFDYEVKKNISDDKSDLDVAIVSSTLFDNQLIKIFNHTNSYDSYLGGEKKSFAFYVLKGWLRPDFIPSDYYLSPNINEVKQKFKTRYGREINIGIYKSWYFFESYHKNNINSIKLNLIAVS